VFQAHDSISPTNAGETCVRCLASFVGDGFSPAFLATIQIQTAGETPGATNLALDPDLSTSSQ